MFTVSLQYLSAAITSIFHTLELVMTALLAFFFKSNDDCALMDWSESDFDADGVTCVE